MGSKVDRRTLLKAAAAGALLPGLSTFARAGQQSPLHRVRPADRDWPSPAHWQALNSAVGGRLVQPQSLFASCDRDLESAACRAVTVDINNPFYIGDRPGGTQVSGWLDAWSPAPSAYAIAAHSSADIAAGVNFARMHNLRLVVKGTGHSYLGTSNAPDSLLIWTRHMKKVVLEDSFVPKGCDEMEPVPAVTAEAGAMWIDLYHAVTSQAGRFVQGGGCADVGVAGLIQSGGFGSFSKGFGTAASHLLEAEIVTADGRVRIANAKRNSDLFWALKGGGGGSWGAVSKLTLRTHDLPTYFGAAWGEIQATSGNAFRRLIDRFFDFYAMSLFNAHWGEQASFAPDNKLSLSLVCQGLTDEEAKAIWKPFFEFVHGAPRDFKVTAPLGKGVKLARNWWDVEGNPAMVPDKRPGAPAYYGWWRGDQGQVGAFLHGYDSTWLPASLLQHRRDLGNAVFAASRFKKLEFHFNKGLAGASDAVIAGTLNTAMNPAATGAFALVIVADGERPQYPGQPGAHLDVGSARQDAHAIRQAMMPLRTIAPGAGSYVSESNYFNSGWQEEYWGSNYTALHAIKRKYDPHGLFFVYHGVGTEEWSADGFMRLAATQ